MGLCAINEEVEVFYLIWVAYSNLVYSWHLAGLSQSTFFVSLHVSLRRGGWQLTPNYSLLHYLMWTQYMWFLMSSICICLWAHVWEICIQSSVDLAYSSGGYSLINIQMCSKWRHKYFCLCFGYSQMIIPLYPIIPAIAKTKLDSQTVSKNVNILIFNLNTNSNANVNRG